MFYEIMFENATVITMEQECTVLKHANVGISKGKIEYISTEKAPENTISRIIDCKNKILMPGLINTHTHLAMMLFRGAFDDYPLDKWLFEKVFPLEAKLDPKCVYIGTKLAIAEGIRTGTTSFTDNYFFTDKIAQAAYESGVKINISNMVTHFGEGEYDPSKDRAIKELMELYSTIHKKDNGKIHVMAGIHAPYTSSSDAWSYVAKMAKEKDLLISLHLSETEKEVIDMNEKYAKTSTELFLEAGVFQNITTCAHSVFMTENDMKILAQNNAVVSHCPVSNLKLASGVADIPKMLELGVKVSLGTDGSCSNNNMDLFEEIKLCAILHKGITKNAQAVPAYEVLKMATVNGAYAQGRQDSAGKIALGYDADIILLDLDDINMHPLFDPISAVVYSASGKDVCMNMVQGKILYEDGNYNTIDVERLKFMLNNYALPHLGLQSEELEG